MLLELRAENYAVIDHAIAAFGPGLNLLTGETGAGKSILVDVLALLLGGKASPDVIRHGADKAAVACVFESTAAAEAILDSFGIDAGEDSEIILRREIQSGGRGRVYVNNQPATVAVLRQLAPELALVHAQSETLGSFDPDQQRQLLDRSAGIETEALGETYRMWKAAAEGLAGMERDEREQLRQADLWRGQIKEIEAAACADGEEERLTAERRMLANAEKLFAAAAAAYELLYDGGSSAGASLRAASRQLEELARYDGRFAEALQQIAAARAAVDDVSATVRDFSFQIQASPDRLAAIEGRLDLLDRLKRKYGSTLEPTLEQVKQYGEEIAEKLAAMENREVRLEQLRASRAKSEEQYRGLAAATTRRRIAAAGKLERAAETQMNSLAMKARFAVTVTAREDEGSWTEHGWDEVECRIATNAGEPIKPLREIASGGELSRVLLALKVSVEECAAASQGRRGRSAAPRTLVFDEIDIGIGGRAAEAVGQKLKALSAVQQILCVTHLPQIAAFADRHFLVEKREKRGRTETSIRALGVAERTEELARMLSGAKLTETSRRHAEQMLKSSR